MVRIKVVDVPSTATAEEAEAILNALNPDEYYLDKIVLTGIPEGVGARAFYRMRVNH